MDSIPSIAKALGISEDDVELTQGSGASPAKLVYLIIGAGNEDGQDAGQVKFYITLYMKTRFYRPTSVAAS